MELYRAGTSRVAKSNKNQVKITTNLEEEEWLQGGIIRCKRGIIRHHGRRVANKINVVTNFKKLNQRTHCKGYSLFFWQHFTESLIRRKTNRGQARSSAAAREGPSANTCSTVRGTIQSSQ